MPAAAAGWRGDQLALLAGQSHQRQSSQEYGDLLAAAEAEANGTTEVGCDPAHQRNLALLRLQLERNRCQDKDLVSALVRAQSHGNAVWQEARRQNDFSHFAPALEQIIKLRLEQAEQLKAAEPVTRSPWEILAQPFEPDISKQRLEVLFDPLRQRLPALLERVPPADGVSAELPESLQEQLSADLLESWGYDDKRCHRSRSAHPFSCTLGPQDYRITTRVVRGNPSPVFWPRPMNGVIRSMSRACPTINPMPSPGRLGMRRQWECMNPSPCFGNAVWRVAKLLPAVGIHVSAKD